MASISLWLWARAKIFSRDGSLINQNAPSRRVTFLIPCGRTTTLYFYRDSEEKSGQLVRKIVVSGVGLSES